MKRIFVTHIVTESLISKYRISTAGCNFSFNLMSGNIFDEVYSILPTNISGGVITEARTDNRYKLVYIDFLRKLGHIACFFSSFIEQFVVFLKIPRTSSVWFYNVTDLNCLIILLLRVFKPNVLINAIVLDYTPSARDFSFRSFLLYLINKSDGNIRLANADCFKCTNYVLLPGVVPASITKEPLIENVANKFLLSGVLTEQISQLGLVLEVFSHLPECELNITGFRADVPLINSYCAKYNNILYHGEVAYCDYLKLLHNCSFVLSTRDPSYPENQCNFPSKVIESLLHNRIIISTIHYPQLKEIRYFEVGTSVENLQSDIAKIIHKSQSELLDYANHSSLIKEYCANNVWRDSMCKIEAVAMTKRK